MSKQIREQTVEQSLADTSAMAELFEAIGFEVADERSYNAIVEQVETNGEWTQLQRGETALHGRCWRLGDGLEVWSLLYQRDADFYYADCRPAFRSRYVHRIERWELVEYEEEGEATVRGVVSGPTEVVFELQNLTELKDEAFRQPHLNVGLAGITYTARVNAELSYRFELAERLEGLVDKLCENDYVIGGRVMAWRDIRNSVTSAELVWIYVDAGVIRLEVLANRQALDGQLKVGAGITANIWLQGHLLEHREISARYEGVDRDVEPADYWVALRKDN